MPIVLIIVYRFINHFPSLHLKGRPRIEIEIRKKYKSPQSALERTDDDTLLVKRRHELEDF